uniref:CASP-like protein n=1 Tax=Arundo donax TaxID=35708 RepID=A0A0A9CSS0_ARUDO
MASVIVQVVVILLDLIAFGLGVAAEQRRSKATVTPDSEKLYDYCVYDSDIATGYGVGALLLLAAAQVVLMVASRCFCCGRGLKPGGSRACALILFLLTW